MNIVRAKIEDLDIINSYLENMRMEKLNEESFSFEPRKIYVIKIGEKIIAFICYLSVVENIELEAVYVEPVFRKRGYAQRLLDLMIDDGLSLNCEDIFLEVRETNENAIKLYQKNGFEMIGCRSKYYGSEDGLVMKKELRCNNE